MGRRSAFIRAAQASRARCYSPRQRLRSRAAKEDTLERGTLKGFEQGQGEEVEQAQQMAAPPEPGSPAGPAPVEPGPAAQPPEAGMQGPAPEMGSAAPRPTMSRQDVYVRPMRAGKPL